MPDNAAKAWFASFVLLVFCLGGVLGFSMGSHLPPRPDRLGPGLFGGRGPARGGAPFGRGPNGPPPLPPNLINQLSRDLQLDASQQDRLKTVLEERRDRFEQLHRDARDRFDKEQRELQAAIRAVLRSEQQQKFDAFLDRRPQPR
jgi:hypothetical protein